MERHPKEFTTSKPLRQRSSEIGNLSVAKDCKNGSFHIRHPNRCKIAAAAFGKKYIGIMKSFGEPHGCLHRKVDQDIMFNRLRTNSTSSDREFVCNSQADPDVKSREPLSKSEAAQLKIYCFGWTVRSEREERILPYARALFETCDGHAFFTDLHSPGEEQSDFVRVELPATQQNRSDKFWLLLKNMVGLLPAWDYLLKNNITESFDWVVNLELDHFFFASVLRQTISEHMNLMTLDRLPGEDPWDDAVMMVFGNVFAFNVPLVQSMKREWQTIGQVITDKESMGLGCPVISGVRAHDSGNCEQDMVYENLRDYMHSSVTIVGANGCGNIAMSDALVPFPLACWQDFVFGDSEDQRLKALKELVVLWNFSDSSQAETYCFSQEELEPHCKKLVRSRLKLSKLFFSGDTKNPRCELLEV
eukprot:symbB.v1.2.010904.t1/scaffold720.1/size169259/15